MIKQTCKRCGGGGILPQFKHIEGGKCYECGGDGITYKDENAQPKKRNVIEYVVYFDNDSEIIGVKKFDKPLNMKTASTVAQEISDGIEYRYLSLCTTEQMKIAGLL